jgi:hypothetical protein
MVEKNPVFRIRNPAEEESKGFLPTEFWILISGY